ncbi:uncharacterized protein LOC132563986 [Ylistrum balloti]|uniref:uncharacterized protein LOC132563986 n=1 Tax=Ylistrum balloti TaxID=509963 RepID=UPI0029057EAE|nr:uncharacterized protein LOC132563986 [Ylistrum balloti]
MMLRMRISLERMKMADANTKRRRGPKSYLRESVRKRKKKESDQNRGQTRIYIRQEIDRWRKMKEDLGLNTDSEFAKLLLDCYELHKKTLDEPTTGHICKKRDPTRGCSESEVTLSGSEMSGVFVQVAESWKHIPVPGPSTTDLQKLSCRNNQKADSATKEESSFINPFEVTRPLSRITDFIENSPLIASSISKLKIKRKYELLGKFHKDVTLALEEVTVLTPSEDPHTNEKEVIDMVDMKRKIDSYDPSSKQIKTQLHKKQTILRNKENNFHNSKALSEKKR